jgi:hypothetical protein
MAAPSRPSPRIARLIGSSTFDTDALVKSVDAFAFEVDALAKVMVTKVLDATKESDWMGANAVLNAPVALTGVSVSAQRSASRRPGCGRLDSRQNPSARWHRPRLYRKGRL